MRIAIWSGGSRRERNVSCREGETTVGKEGATRVGQGCKDKRVLQQQLKEHKGSKAEASTAEVIESQEEEDEEEKGGVRR